MIGNRPPVFRSFEEVVSLRLQSPIPGVASMAPEVDWPTEQRSPRHASRSGSGTTDRRRSVRMSILPRYVPTGSGRWNADLAVVVLRVDRGQSDELHSRMLVVFRRWRHFRRLTSADRWRRRQREDGVGWIERLSFVGRQWFVGAAILQIDLKRHFRTREIRRIRRVRRSVDVQHSFLAHFRQICCFLRGKQLLGPTNDVPRIIKSLLHQFGLSRPTVSSNKSPFQAFPTLTDPNIFRNICSVESINATRNKLGQKFLKYLSKTLIIRDP